MSPVFVSQRPPADPPPWGLTVRDLFAVLTASQRETVAARLRVKGYPATTSTPPAA